MGSITGSVGSDGGVRIPPLDAPQPLIRSGATWIITSLYDPNYQAALTAFGGYVYVPFEYGWRSFTFQLVVGVPGGNGGITIAGTNDPLTAQNPAGTAWETLPSSGTPFPNPLQLQAGTKLFCADSGPWAAFRLVSGGSYPLSSASYILFGASS